MKPQPTITVEALESRTLLSSSLPMVVSTAPLTKPVASAAASANMNAGVTLNLTAGVVFTGKVAFYASPVIDPPGGLAASINWGDGTVTQGTLQYGVHGTTGGYDVTGSHTYQKTGIFKIQTTVSLGPIPGSGAEFPTRIVARIISKAIVSRGNSTGGVTIRESAGAHFTADLGSFATIAPGQGLHALINWGDGKSSIGSLQSAGVIGIDVLTFNVIGDHAYLKPGTYPIHVVVTQSSPSPSAAAAVRVVATIQSTAIVASVHQISLAGTISGSFKISSPIPDIGQTYELTGAGSAGVLGTVNSAGDVKLPGFIASGRARGILTLSNSSGSVMLALVGPIEKGFGPFPSALTYVLVKASGAYAGDKASGSIAVTIDSTNNSFTFSIT